MGTNVQPLTGPGAPTKDDVYELVEEHNVEFLRLQFTDIMGQVKNVSVPITQLDKAFEEGIWFDGSSIEGFVRINESDMRLEPDPATFAILPWTMDRSVGPTARMICDVLHQNGGPFAGDPRYVLKRVLERAEDKGFTLNVGPEAEFFLFKTDENGKPTTVPTDSGGYFDLDPVDAASPVRKDINVALARMGFEVEASHHEVAAGQHEIDFKYADALTTADRVATFRTVVRTIAQQHGWHATFMPKPIAGINGSGMHCHLSLFDSAGNNAMFDEGDEHDLSKTAYQFLGGLLEHAKAITAVANPTVNSYKRLVPGYEAPVYVAWSNVNRSALVRIPRASGKGKRVELRSPDPSCNPYLAFAVMLAAGLDGIDTAAWPGEAVEENIYEFTEERRKELGIPVLPGNLGEAITELAGDQVVLDALGEHVAGKFIQAKRAEWNEYRTQVSPWEIDTYLATY